MRHNRAQRRTRHAAGFTLLEIVLVIAILALVTALVAPNLLPAGGGALEEEADRLRQVLQLAVDEAQMSGSPLRWSAWHDRYRFERRTEARRWLPMSEAPFAPRKLDGVVLDRVLENGIEQRMAIDMQPSGEEGSRTGEEPPIGRARILPGGMVTPLDIVLRDADHPDSRRTVRLRPGPAGVVVVDPAGEGR